VDLHFKLDLSGICRNIASINWTRIAGGFSGRRSPGNRQTPDKSDERLCSELPIGTPMSALA
jgi:hypothetical protein